MRRVVAILAAISLAACSPSGGTTPSTAPTGTPTGSVSPTGSSAPEPARTPIAGYETWQTINPQAARISLDEGALVMELIGSKLWFNAERGVLFHTEITGDFRATATVRTARSSDPSAQPGRDGTIQLAGFMARAEVPVENYVFIVTGSIGASTGVETKTTTSSHSISVQRGVPTAGDADLRLCREGETFRLAWRPPGSTEGWQELSTFERPDLPESLQVGANIFTDAEPDLVARFEGLQIEPLVDGATCQ